MAPDQIWSALGNPPLIVRETILAVIFIGLLLLTYRALHRVIFGKQIVTCKTCGAKMHRSAEYCPKCPSLNYANSINTKGFRCRSCKTFLLGKNQVRYYATVENGNSSASARVLPCAHCGDQHPARLTTSLSFLACIAAEFLIPLIGVVRSHDGSMEQSKWLWVLISFPVISLLTIAIFRWRQGLPSWTRT